MSCTWCGVGEQTGNKGTGRWSSKRRLANEHLVQDATQAVDVASSVDVAFTRSLLRAHVRRRAKRDSRLREATIICRGNRTRNAKVGDDGMTVFQQDVLQLDITMYHALAVSVVEGVGDFDRDANRAFDGESGFTIEAFA